MWKSLSLALVMAGFAITSATVAAVGNATNEPLFTIQKLYEFCKSSDSDDHFICIGYVSGMMDTMTIIGTRHDASANTFGMCPKTTVSYGAGIQVFKNWAEKHPETWGGFRSLGVFWAFKEMWPCA
jgi:hypothetical protein